MSQQYFFYYLFSVLSFVVALVVHEVSHGFAAYKLGDPTAKRSGRLSLNPLKHVDPFGTVVLPLLLMLMNWPIFGYAKPVPYNPSYFKDPRKGDVIVGLAGPASNLVMALVAAAFAALFPLVFPSAFQIDAFLYFYVWFIPLFIQINLCLMFFNLLPIPPLDGSSVFAILVPRKYLPKYYEIQQWAFPVFMIAMVVLPYVLGVNPFSWYLNATAGNLSDFLLSAAGAWAGVRM